MAGHVPDPPVPDSLATQLRTVLQSAQDVHSDQHREASRLADEWCVAAVDAGWTVNQVASATGVSNVRISERVRRARARSRLIRPAGVPSLLPAPPAPAGSEPPAEQLRRRLVKPAVAARIAGCAASSVKDWAQMRGVAAVRLVEGGPRLYDPDAIQEAARTYPSRATLEGRDAASPPPPPNNRT